MLDTNEPRVSSVPSGHPQPAQNAVDDLLIQLMRTWLMSSSMNDRMHRGHSEPCRARQMILTMILGKTRFQFLTREARMGSRWRWSMPAGRSASLRLGGWRLVFTARVGTMHRSCRLLDQAHFNGLRGKRACAREVIAQRCAYYSASQLSSYSTIKREPCLGPALACTGITTAGGTP
jgi:hypothetical protein